MLFFCISELDLRAEIRPIILYCSLQAHVMFHWRCLILDSPLCCSGM